MRARIYPLALGKIIKHTSSNPHREVAGLLVGKSHSNILEIWDAVTGEQHGTPAFVHLDETVMASVAEQLSQSNSGLYIVGWYHSHPGLDVFLSPTDIDTQRRYQLLYPKAVALVIDPAEYIRTKRISSLRFKVFHLSKDGKVMVLPVSIGINRAKLLESTVHGLSTYDQSKMIQQDNHGGQHDWAGRVGLLEKARKLLRPSRDETASGGE